MFGNSSCCTPTIASRVRASFVLLSTALPAAVRTPVAVSNWELLDDGMPVSSLAWTTLSRLASVQHDPAAAEHWPLDAFEPKRSRVCTNNPPRSSANVIFVW